ncbi:Bone morphoproteintic protein 1 [Sparganum proliferum]
MGDVALSESDMKSMQAQKDYGESGSSSEWTDDEDSDDFDERSEVEASQYDLAGSMNWNSTNSTRREHNGKHRKPAKRQGRTASRHGLWVPPWKKSGGNYSTGADETKNRSRRAVMSTRHNIWPSGIVPVIMNSGLSNSARTVIIKAIRTWESLTCLRFVNRQAQHKSYIIFSVEDCGCCSYVGRQSDSRPQTVSIGPGCEVEGIALHEIGHALGFWHEQSRPDRDNYVQIFTQNIQPSNLFNFDKMSYKEVDSLGEPYDFNSIMHYHSSAFAKPGTYETIRPRPCCPRPQIGQRSKPSASDVRQMNKLYNCPVAQTGRSSSRI